MTLMFLDGLLIILLLFGIKAVKEFYDKYKEFLQLKDDLNCILRHVQLSMKSSQTTIETLQKNIQFASEHVTPHLPEANNLKNDLGFLIEQGEKVADRLENLARDVKKNYLTPQTIVFEPKELVQAEKYTEPSMEKKSDDKTVENKGFFATVTRRVR